MRRSTTIKTMFGILLVVFLLASSSSSYILDANDRQEPLPSQTGHEPITIASDEDFVTQGWPGTGTTEDPYVIEGLEFNTGYETYINVSHVDSVFLIRNCWFNYSYIAIALLDVEDCIIANCTFVTGIWGIRVLNSTRCTLANNSFAGTFFPVESEYTSHFEAVGNSFNSSYSLYQSYCQDILFRDNDFIHWFGPHVSECESFTFIENRIWGPTRYEHYFWYPDTYPIQIGALTVDISNNSFFNSTNSLLVSDFFTQSGPATSVVVSNNNFTDGGLSFSPWLSASTAILGDFSGNTVRGQPTLVLRGSQSTSVDCSDYPQVLAIGCNNTVFTGGPFQQVGTGLALYGCTNSIVDGVSAVRCGTGVVIGHSTDTTIEGVRTDTCNTGIALGASSRATVTDCDFSNGSTGILMTEVLDITVTRCDIHENYRGIELWGSRNCLFYANVFDNMRNVEYRFSSVPIDRWDDGIGTGNVWNDYFGLGPYIVDTEQGRTLADHFPVAIAPWTQTPSFLALTGSLVLLLIVFAIFVISFVTSRQRGGWFADAVRTRYNWLLVISFAWLLLAPYVLTIGFSDYGELHWTMGALTYSVWSDLGWIYSSPSFLSIPPLSQGLISLLTLFVLVPLTFGLTWRSWQQRKSSETSRGMVDALLWLALTLVIFAFVIYQLPYERFWGLLEVSIPLPIAPVLAFLTLRLAEPRVPEGSSEQSGASIKPSSPNQDGTKEQGDHNAQNDTSGQDA